MTLPKFHSILTKFVIAIESKKIGGDVSEIPTSGGLKILISLVLGDVAQTKELPSDANIQLWLVKSG